MRRIVFLIILLGLTGTQIAGQTTDFTLDRYGSVGVSDAEVEQITDLVSGTGKRPWLMLSSNLSGPRARLFLEPDVVSPQIVRGRMLMLEADQPTAAAVRSWKILTTYSYACIPLPGSRPGELRSPDDPGWPFIVQGEFDDDTLITMVAFIRSEPRIPGVPETAGKRSVGRGPISHI